MATVTGKSSSKIDQLLGETLVDANLDNAGSLTFTKKSGSTINAGSLGRSIVGATINTAKRLIFTKMDGSEVDAGSIVPNLLAAWPVTSVYIGMSPANPATLLGGGTWVRIGKGQMLVGVDENDTAFDAVRETGGSKTKVLVAANLPPHPHTIAHTHDITHSHASRSSPGPAPSAGGTTTAFTRADGDNIISGGGMVGAFGGDTGPSLVPNSGNGPGASAPVDVMNPYITTYIWERTA